MTLYPPERLAGLRSANLLRAYGSTDPAEVATVLQARLLRLAGHSLREVGRALAAGGSHPRGGGEWTATQIMRLVR